MRIVICLLSILVIVQSGCASRNTLPRDLPTMRDVYDEHLVGKHPSAINQELDAARKVAVRPLLNSDAHLAAYTRAAYNEIENLFPYLPNPTLIMYIDPHLSEAGYPVPGYSTAFTLYEKPEFALPGEAPPPMQLTPVE